MRLILIKEFRSLYFCKKIFWLLCFNSASNNGDFFYSTPFSKRKAIRSAWKRVFTLQLITCKISIRTLLISKLLRTYGALATHIVTVSKETQHSRKRDSTVNIHGKRMWLCQLADQMTLTLWFYCQSGIC